MPIYFTQSGAGYADTGLDADASIQPVADGELATAAIFGRPEQNLRRRTEELKRAQVELEDNLRGTKDMVMSLVKPGTATYTSDGTGRIEKVTYAASGGTPGSDSYYFYPNTGADTSVLMLSSPVIPEGRVALIESVFTDFYDTPDDSGVISDLGMNRPGDTIAVRFALKNTPPAHAVIDPVPPAQDLTEAKIDNERLFSELTAGNSGDGDVRLVKLPQKRSFKTSEGAIDFSTLLAGFISGAAYPYTVDDPDNLHIRINEDIADWFTPGGRGGRDGGGTYDTVKITRILSATELEVSPETPFRLVNHTDGATPVAWSVYDAALLSTEVTSTGKTGYTEALPSNPDELLIPIVTFTGSGFVLHHGGGYVPLEQVSAVGGTGPALSLTLPWAYQPNDLQIQRLRLQTLSTAVAGVIQATGTPFKGAYVVMDSVEVHLVGAYSYTTSGTDTIVLDVGTSGTDDEFIAALDVNSVTASEGHYSFVPAESGLSADYLSQATFTPMITVTSSEVLAWPAAAGEVFVTFRYYVG
jgi:hypothetical protein